MYKIKQKLEDFIVEEITNLEFEKGDYSYFLLEKYGYSTQKAIDIIARKFGIKTKLIGYAGNKDKNAITRQYISVYNPRKIKLPEIMMKDISLNFLGYGRDRINLGGLIGNKFEIAVRNLENKINKNIDCIENYFDEQRFGYKNSVYLVGKAIINKNFGDACRLLRLNVEGNDFVNALRKLDRRVLRFYISSYQSYLWNNVVSEYLKNNKDFFELKTSFGNLTFLNNIEYSDKKIPIVGFNTEFDDEKIKMIYSEILKKENIKLEDFVVRQLLEVSSEGSERSLFVKVGNFKIRYEKDELNKGKYKANLNFELSKGSYATIVVKKLFS